MHFANCAALAAVLFTTLIENLRLCTFAEAGLLCFYKIDLIKKCTVYYLPFVSKQQPAKIVFDIQYLN